MTPDTLHATASKRLVRRAQKGDAAAFESLARAHTSTLYRVASSCLSGNEADVNDALQETLVAAWRAIGSLEKPRYFKTWIIRICINSCRQLQRRRKPAVPLEALGEEGLDAALRAAGKLDDTARAAAEDDANSAFQRLVVAAGESYALVITLYYGEGYSAAEIADLLSLTPETVRQRLFRGRRRIAQSLGELQAPPQPSGGDAPARRSPSCPARPRGPDDAYMQAVHPASV